MELFKILLLYFLNIKDDYKSAYETSISMRISEAQIQWERYNAMLVINTIFIGIVGYILDKKVEFPLIVKIIIPIFGIIFCLLWLQITQRGFMWINHWTEKAKEIEEKYMSKSLAIFNEGNKYRIANYTNINTEAIACLIISIFILMYLVSILYIAGFFLK